MRLLLALLLLVPLVPLTAGDSGDAPKVAVLRLFDAITTIKSFQARVEVFKQEKASNEAKIKDFDEVLQKLTTSIEAIPAGNEKLGQLQEEFEATKARRESFVRRAERDFERRQIVTYNEQYKTTRVLLKEFCKSRGIKLVVQAASNEIGAQNLTLVNLRAEMQTALYFDDDQDITEAFISFANQKIAEKAGEKTAEPATGGAK